MIHFIDEPRHSLQYTEDLVLLCATLDRHHELLLCLFCQEATLRLNDEEDDLYVAFNVHLDSSHVSFEEAVRLVIAFKAVETLTVALYDVA